MSLQANSSSKQEFIFLQLQSRIVDGMLPIGAQIPTEEELAAEFHCSRGTVSRAVARLVQERLVERKTRSGTRVIRNTIERNASTLDLDACAFIYPADQHESSWRMLRGFQQAACAAKRRTLMLSAGEDCRKEAEIVGRLSEFNVRGAALFPIIINPGEMAYYSQMIHSCPFPVVLLELNIAGIGRPSVVVDGLHAGYTMTRYLLQQGLRRIGFFANYAWAPFIRDRYLGYRQAHEEAGLAVDENRVMLETVMTPNFEDPLQETTRIADLYLERNRDLEGVVCSHDFAALGLIQMAQSKGIRVPETLKVTGIDDYAISATSPVPLTTYHVSYETLGQRAFEMLNSQMSGSLIGSQEVQIRGELVIRQSA